MAVSLRREKERVWLTNICAWCVCLCVCVCMKTVNSFFHSNEYLSFPLSLVFSHLLHIIQNKLYLVVMVEAVVIMRIIFASFMLLLYSYKSLITQQSTVVVIAHSLLIVYRPNFLSSLMRCRIYIPSTKRHPDTLLLMNYGRRK